MGLGFVSIYVDHVCGAGANTNALLGGANHATAELDLLEAIDQLMDIEDDLSAVGDEYPSIGAEALFVQGLELVEEGGDVNDAAAANDIDAARVHEAGGEDVEVVGDAVDDDGVAGIVTTLSAAAELGFVGEDVGELSFALIAPLGTENDGDGHGRADGSSRRGGDGARLCR